MNNKKGFTLIELLIVIAILGLLGIIVTINLNKTLNQANQKRCNAFVEELEDAACTYVELKDQEVLCNRENGCDSIKVGVLLRAGLITSEKNACTGEDINEEDTVSITWNNNEKNCHYEGARVYAR